MLFRSASVILLHQDVELLPVVNMDGSRKVSGVMTAIDVIVKAIEPMTERRGDDRRLAS